MQKTLYQRGNHAVKEVVFFALFISVNVSSLTESQGSYEGKKPKEEYKQR